MTNITDRWSLITFAFLAFLAGTGPGIAQQEEGRVGEVLFQTLGALGRQAIAINREAMEVFESAPREGSCNERRERFHGMLTSALRYSRHALEIYSAEFQAEMDERGLSSLDLRNGRRAYYDREGQRYAESHMDAERRQVVVAFQGTRLSVKTDISTNVLNFVGMETDYHEWAEEIVGDVMHDHPDLQVIATGDSLGGGLAIYAVLGNPGAKAFVFNPAGLSHETWDDADPMDRERTNRDVIAISTRNLFRIEPVTALSLAGRSTLPGQIFIVRAASFLPKRLHSIKTMIWMLKRLSQKSNRIDCYVELGVLAR
ncbi:MAG: hypothetical protein KTR19_10070 [Hyphomicrobiales bacterium]|nr:hypothetical protein [Hyphomicrobiales bacterium]